MLVACTRHAASWHGFGLCGKAHTCIQFHSPHCAYARQPPKPMTIDRLAQAARWALFARRPVLPLVLGTPGFPATLREWRTMFASVATTCAVELQINHQYSTSASAACRSGDYDDCSGAVRDFSLKSHPLQQASTMASPHKQQQPERPQPATELQPQAQQSPRQVHSAQSRQPAAPQTSTPRKQQGSASGAAAGTESDDDGDFSAVSDTNETEVQVLTTAADGIVSRVHHPW
jgi:hypothetical protein